MQFVYRRLRSVLCGLALVGGVAVLGAGQVEATASSGACCRLTECAVTDQFSCEEGGGTFLGDATSCANQVCGGQAAVPAYSLLGLVGMTGALAGLALFRLVRRPGSAAA